MSGRYSRERRRQRGSLLLGQLMALALLSYVLAQAVSSYGAADRAVRLAGQGLERRQEARWAMRQLAQDMAMHGRLGCGQEAWRRDDFGKTAWTLSLPGRWLRHRQAVLDDAGGLRRLLLEPQDGDWRAWRESRLVSCGESRRLSGADARWGGGATAPSLELAAALPAGSLHLPSLQLWLPRQRQYRLLQPGRSGQLRVSDALGGVADGGERLALEGVKSLTLRVLVQNGCGTAARWAWRDIGALTAGEAGRLMAARVTMEWYPESGEDEVIELSQDAALAPLEEPCGGVS